MYGSFSSRCLIVTGLLAIAATCHAGEEAERLTAIAESALFNRNAFPFIDCRFVLTHGTCDSENEPIADGPRRVLLSSQGTWIVRKDEVKYELEVDPTVEQQRVREAIAAETAKTKDTPAKGRVTVALGMKFVSRRVLWNGTNGMSYTPLMAAGALFRPDERGPSISITPFDLVGMMGPDESRHPGSLIAARDKTDGVTCRFAGSDDVGGRNLLVVSYDETSGKQQVRSRYWFDPERGFLPVQMTRQYDDPSCTRTKVVVTDVRECSGGRWFPMRSVAVLSPGTAQPDDKLDVFELVVHELDVDSPAPDVLLALDIPQGARLHNGVEPNSQDTLQKPRRICIADLRDLEEDMSRRAEGRRVEHAQYEQQAQPLEEPEGGTNWLAITASAAALLFVVTLLWLRHRRQKGLHDA